MTTVNLQKYLDHNLVGKKLLSIDGISYNYTILSVSVGTNFNMRPVIRMVVGQRGEYVSCFIDSDIFVE